MKVLERPDLDVDQTLDKGRTALGVAIGLLFRQNSETNSVKSYEYIWERCR